MIVFTWIGIIVVVALALALLFVLVTAALSGRVGKIETAWRRFRVIYPDTTQDPNGPFKTYTNYWLDKVTQHFTFRGAARAAKKVRGTRIYDVWDMSYPVVRSGWSESRNGYVADRDAYGY
jgi:hypothetical protein